MNHRETFSNGLSCLIAFGLLVFSIATCIHQYRLEKKHASWPSVEGKITSWNESDFTVTPSGPARRKVNQTSIDVSYEFQLGDDTYTGKAHFNSKASPRWIPGGKRQLTEYDNFPVQVFYNPLNPKQNVLERAKFTFEWYFWPVFILCPLGIFFYLYDTFFKSDSKPKHSFNSFRSSPPASRFPSSNLQSIPPLPPPSSRSRFFSWIHDNQLVFFSLIILVSVIIYCLATRYTSHPKWAVTVDRWTGRVIDSDSDDSSDSDD